MRAESAAGAHPGWSRLLLSWLFFFCVLGSYYVLRPVRDAFGVSSGLRDLKWLYTGTFVAMLVVSPLFSALTTRFAPRRLVPWVYHAFAVQLGVFALSLPIAVGTAHALIADGFYVWVSVYNLFVVSVFWSLMADLWHPEEGRRWFGVIASGGSAGGFTGALLTERLVEGLGSSGVMWVSIALLEGAAICALLLRRRAPAPARSPDEDVAARAQGAGLLAGARLVLRSRYLLTICAFLLLTTVCGSIAHYERSAIVEAATSDQIERIRSFGRMDQLTNLGILLLQAFAARPLMRRLGVGMTLALLPMLYAFGFLSLALAPTLLAITIFEALRRSVGFGLATPTNQVLYTSVSPEEKYAAKNFIETAVWRGGDLTGIHLADLVAAAGARLSLLAVVTLPVTALWTGVALRLGRVHARRAVALETAGPS